MPSSLLNLPPDLLPLLATHLPYPDLLALRHTHPYFYYSALLGSDRNSNIRLKVAWLVDRKARGLPCPTNSRTVFRTDREFCASREVRAIMERRRKHGDCGVGGCEVVRGRMCEGPRLKRRWGWELRGSVLAVVIGVLVWVLSQQRVWGVGLVSEWTQLGGYVTANLE